MKTYLVGGAVRDRILGLKVHDRDFVVTGATPEMMLERGFRQVGKDFPVFLHPETHEEYALARTEKKSGHGYGGFICDFSPDITIEEDLSRRDLTINAMAMDEDGNIVDPWGGMSDLKKHLLRHTSPAFEEDPLRVLRVARFAARFAPLGFTVATGTMELIKKMVRSGELSYLVPERVWQEFYKVLQHGMLDVFVRTLHECGALRVVFPELDALYGVPARKDWHPEVDTGIHMELCLRIISDDPDPVVKFGVFCHDFGKALTPKEQLPRHPMHGPKGKPLVERMCERLRIPNEYRDFARIVCENHSLVHRFIRRSRTSSALKVFYAIDAFRHPERVPMLAKAAATDYHGRLGFENLPYQPADYMLDMFEAVRKVTPADIIRAGAKGIQIKQRLARHRMRALVLARREWFATHEIIPEKGGGWSRAQRALEPLREREPDTPLAH